MKITAAWPSDFTLSKLPDLIASAKEIGFDSFAWTSNKNEEFFIDECKKKSITPIKVIAPLKKRDGARLQKMYDSEYGFDSTSDTYQYGGEPIFGEKEVLNQELLCPLDESIIPHTIEMVRESIKKGFSGICWDFIGYQNYSSCQCEVCINHHENKSENQFYEKILIELQDQLYMEIKRQHSTIPVLSHNHPVFLPNPFYSQNAMLDYNAITVSWFFKPHWSLEKVENYIQRTINGPYKYSFSSGMPMFGFYGCEPFAKHSKSAERIEKELALFVKYSSKSIMYAELSNILMNNEIKLKIISKLKCQ